MMTIAQKILFLKYISSIHKLYQKFACFALLGKNSIAPLDKYNSSLYLLYIDRSVYIYEHT